MRTHNQSLPGLTSPHPRRRVPWWWDALWLFVFCAAIVAMLYVAIIPSNIIYAPGLAATLHWPFIVLAVIYGIITANAGHRLGTWQMAMWGQLYGPKVMWVALAAVAAVCAWLHFYLTLPYALSRVGMKPFEMHVDIDAVRGGGQAADSRDRFVLDLVGQTRQPYEVTLKGFSRFDRIETPDGLGLTALPYGSVYSKPVPAIITGRGNGLVLVVETIARLP